MKVGKRITLKIKIEQCDRCLYEGKPCKSPTGSTVVDGKCKEFVIKSE